MHFKKNDIFKNKININEKGSFMRGLKGANSPTTIAEAKNLGRGGTLGG